MLKLLPVFTLLYALALPPEATAEITAEEVARHHGIYFLKIPADRLPESFQLQLVEIRNGKVYEEPHVGVAATLSFDKRSVRSLTISSSLTELGKLQTVITSHPAFQPLRASFDRPRPRGICTFRTELSKVPLNQPILLFAQESRIDGWTLIPEKLDDVLWGVAIIISALPPSTPAGETP